ncbi:MAG TPA: hypothetical protein P5184_03425, partial [Bacteroidales bacterium]|nr:hypothetical protein [Bacteroidales bacterium]
QEGSSVFSWIRKFNEWIGLRLFDKCKEDLTYFQENIVLKTGGKKFPYIMGFRKPLRRNYYKNGRRG